MHATYATKVTAVKPGSGESVRIPGFGAMYKIYGKRTPCGTPGRFAAGSMRSADGRSRAPWRSLRRAGG
jgi:hypothetical protein